MGICGENLAGVDKLIPKLLQGFRAPSCGLVARGGGTFTQ